MPPVHPAIVHFPIALLTFSVIADLFGYIYDGGQLRAAGWWSLLGAAIGGAFAVAAGLYDMKREKTSLLGKARSPREGPLVVWQKSLKTKVSRTI